VRIIAGKWRGRKLAAPPGAATRPTSDRVRESLFSMLASRLGSFEDLTVADLYAGSGALGFEALSRGASFACFVEPDAGAAAAIRANAASLGADQVVRVLAAPVDSVRPDRSFDLVFADPPYAPGSGSHALRHILASGWGAPGAWVAIETERGEGVDPKGCTIQLERDIARARITLLTV